MRKIALAASEHKAARLALAACLIAGLCLCALTIFLMTVEYDEAWIVASTGRLVNPALHPEVVTVFTTGGAYALIMGLAETFGLPLILTGRLLAFASLMGILHLIDRLAKTWFPSIEERLFVLVMALAAPGTLTLGAMAYGVAPATLAFLGAVAAWEALAEKRMLRIAVAGILLGVAMATRLTFVPVLPVFLIWSLLNLKNPKSSIVAGGASMLVALLVFSGFLILQFTLANNGELDLDAVLRNNLSSTGAGSTFPTAASLLSFLVKGSLLAPVALVALVLAVAWGRRFDTGRTPAGYESFVQILTLAALAIAGFWLLKSPFQHVRYIWPAVLFFYIAGGIYLAEAAGSFMRKTGKHEAAFICLLVAVSLFAQTLLANTRLAAMGAGMQTNAAGQELLENHYKAFWLIREQHEIVRYLQTNTEPGATLVAFGLPGQWGRLQLALLSNRNIVELEDWVRGDAAPDYFVVHRYSNVNADGKRWLAAHADKLTSIKGYELYKPRPGIGAPEFETAIDPQLYRFTLPRTLSLSGGREAN